MFVHLMMTDDWRNRVDHGISIAEPTWAEVRLAIEGLDGRHRTTVTLFDKEDSERYLIIAGQWAGKFMVNATIDGNDFFSLVDSSLPKDRKILFAGGQDGDYEERKCVPLLWALEAAQTFFETGELNPALAWLSDY